MSDVTYVGQRVASIKSADEFDGISRVILTVSDEVEYVSGNGTGRTIKVQSPWGTQKAADDILKNLRGFQYQPYTASGAMIDPAAELGDAVTVGYVYSGIYEENAMFGRTFVADLAAPFEEELDHEYPYVPKQERAIRRQMQGIQSEFKVQAEKIAAKVEKTGGDPKSFGWELEAESWTLKSKSKDVLIANEEGITIDGIIRARDGTIGGFDIRSDHLSYNEMDWDSNQPIGGYLGIHGLKMGANFKVDMQGNLYAASGEFSGSVKAANIKYGTDPVTGKDYGYFDGAGLSMGSVSGGKSGAIALKSITVDNVEKNVKNSLDAADYSKKIFAGDARCQYVKAQFLDAEKTFTLKGRDVRWGTIKDMYGIDHDVVVWDKS